MQINQAKFKKKATGRDGISAKLLKFAKPAIVKPITNLINKSINNSIFPEKLKEAQVVPLFKKNNSLDKCNYRSVSILPTISKFYERAIYEQTVTFFDKVFHPFLSAFRSGYGCQIALLKIIEDKFVAVILMDLSKAFDCLPHKLLINKLDAYGVSESALKLIKNYLSNRKQCVKIGNIMSDWEDIYKGVPQGSF